MMQSKFQLLKYLYFYRMLKVIFFCRKVIGTFSKDDSMLRDEKASNDREMSKLKQVSMFVKQNN